MKNHLYKHGYAHKERLYEIWKNMKRRCFDASLQSFENYGGRGITVCDDWAKDYLSFREWSVRHGYSDTLTLDRIDNGGNYDPENCRWSTYTEQNNNRRDNRIETINGHTGTLAQICRQYGVKYKSVWRRLNRGWSLIDALTKNCEAIQ